MQAVILAAGMGRRLGHYTDDNTKCMVKVGGTTLIDRALTSLTRYKLSRIVLVIGYKGENLRAHVGSSYNNVPVEYVTNDIFDKTNNIYSLYLAREYMLQEDTLLLESDLIFRDEVIDRLVNDPHRNLVLVSRYESWMDGTVLELNDDGSIKAFLSKGEFRFRKASRYFKTVNIYKFSAEFFKESYLPFLEAYQKSVGVNEYYEQVLSVINFVRKKDLRACVLEKGPLWYEIDDKQDLDNAELLFAAGEEKLTLIQQRYGGYWRYPHLIDFCYLVNPYFPCKNLKNELKKSFSTLLREYPSGQDVQDLLASKMFDISRHSVLVGNGAAELINGLLSSSDETWGFIRPTFNEYPARVPEARSRFFEPTSGDFSYTVDELLEFARPLDNLVLINPDNPTGHFLQKSELFRLLDGLQAAQTRLILDESFVDFSVGGEENSIISEEVLQKYPRLVVIKSISKSYGVPGLRLGVLASRDSELLRRVRSSLSIWNINSFAEFFLQIIGKYKKEYLAACTKIVKRRESLYTGLEGISWLSPFKSEANYITCELKGRISAHDLTRVLLEEHNLFIKDLSGKPGFPEDREFIRLAVRNKGDNRRLIDALSQI